MATVQALVILSSFEAASIRDARGWLYSGKFPYCFDDMFCTDELHQGMAMRLSFDLGLHIDMTPYVQSGRMDAAEAEVRKITFWGCFIVDQ